MSRFLSVAIEAPHIVDSFVMFQMKKMKPNCDIGTIRPTTA
jgi:hypothetical protein